MPLLLGLTSFTVNRTNFSGINRDTVKVANIDRELKDWSEAKIKPTTGYSFWAEKQEMVSVRIWKEYLIVLTRTPLSTVSQSLTTSFCFVFFLLSCQLSK